MTRRTLISLSAAAAAGLAQTQVEKHQRIVIAGPGGGDIMMWHGEGGPGFPHEFGPNTFEFIASEKMGFEASPIKGAPYSAEGVTETTQVLADGNRISRKNTSVFYRDSEGRTRREQSLAALGPWASKGAPHQTIMINDPVAGVHYVLDPEARTARKMAVPEMKTAAAKMGVAQFKARTAEGGVGGFHKGMAIHFEKALPAGKGPKPRMESLGKRMIEGVEAEGTRTTLTIPAGQIGNDRPIEVVSEHWFSEQLKTVVMSKRSDPRQGETTYRLTNIRLAEPLRSLFEAPPDYTIKEEANVIRKKMTMPKPPQ